MMLKWLQRNFFRTLFIIGDTEILEETTALDVKCKVSADRYLNVLDQDSYRPPQIDIPAYSII